MNLDRVLTEIDLEISRLQQAKQLLSENASNGAVVKRGPGRPSTSAAKTSFKSSAGAAAPRKRVMSAAGRARIAAAQKARWAKTKKAAKKAAGPSLKTKSATKKVAKKASGKKVGRPAGKPKTAPAAETAATPAS